MPGYTPQQQQLLAMRQQQSQMQMQMRPAVQEAPAPVQVRQVPPTPLRLERTFNPVRDPNAAWSVQGAQPALGLAVQGGSLVFQQTGVVALYVSIQKAPKDTLLRVVNPLTHVPVAFAYADDTFAYLSLVKPVDAGEAWQVQTLIPFPEELQEGSAPPEVQPVSMVAQVMRLA